MKPQIGQNWRAIVGGIVYPVQIHTTSKKFVTIRYKHSGLKQKVKHADIEFIEYLPMAVPDEK